MQKLSLTTSQEQILHDQVINANEPGSMLRDFEMLLNFVGNQGVKAAGKYNLLPIEAIPELNERLSRPLALGLRRPQLRSHPYLQGLHLLLRASALGRVEGTSAKARLALDPQVLDSWRKLSATEQYFTLLEAWLLIGNPEMIGERGGRFESFLSDVIFIWRGIPAKGLNSLQDRPPRAYLYCPRLYHAALMDLFGLIKLLHARAAVQPWYPAGIKHVPFGDAVFTLLGNWQYRSWEEETLDDDSEEERSIGTIRFGRWQELFQPYFPEWRENLVFSEPTAREGVFVFRVALGKIWRQIAITSHSSLDDLALAILDSVDFDDDHLYEFIYRNRFGATESVCHPESQESPFTDEVRVGDLPLEPGQSMKFVFDFGDNWQFDVKLERIDPPGKRMRSPKILAKHGKAPPQYGESDW